MLGRLPAIPNEQPPMDPADVDSLFDSSDGEGEPQGEGEAGASHTIPQGMAPGSSHVHAARLKQALYNYLSNAIKFTPEGGSIALSARPEGAAMLRIEVEDSGIGIAEADLPRLFVEFQQLDAGLGRQHGGTGLGLALTRRLVQAQGGDVGVRSTPGQGSVFHLVLPRLATAGATGLPASAVGPGRLLVVEPDMRSREQLVQALAHDGYRADAAAGATQALAQAVDQAYDGITLQMLLPGPRGLGLLSDIRQRGASRGTPVLGMAFTAEPGRAAVFAVADVLAKPIDSLQVVAAMRRCGLLEPPGQAVLVVDDEAPALELMQSTLAAAGLLPHGERSGPQALAVLDAVRPSAIVLDLMMPGMDGFAVLDALQALPAWRDTPVFIWTSMVLADEDYARLSGSARAILDKGGGTLQSLLARLRAWRPRTTPVLPTTEGDAP